MSAWENTGKPGNDRELSVKMPSIAYLYKKNKKNKHYCPKNDFNISLFTIYVPKTLEGVEGVDGAALVAKRPGSRLESGKLGLDASGL